LNSPHVDGIKIAFIGAILKNAPDVIMPKNVIGLRFLDEADTINQYIPEIKAQGVNTIVVLIHQGGLKQEPYAGDTQQDATLKGDIVDVIKRLDDSVDVVMAGHTHLFHNALVTNQHGKSILVAQANSYSSDFAEVTLTIDSKTDKVLKKSARIITSFADAGPGLSPDPEAARLVNQASETVAPMIQEKIGVLQNDLPKTGNAAGESTLGNLVADALRFHLHTDIALQNPGGIRADLHAGDVTWGHLYAVNPFGTPLVKMTLTGEQLYQILEQQWTPNNTIILQVSGMRSTYDDTKPIGQRIVSVTVGGFPVARDRLYTVATNGFLAGGGDGFTVMRQGHVELTTQEVDLEVLIDYIKSLPQPFTATYEDRTARVMP
jgi:5'-nucleotidase